MEYKLDYEKISKLIGPKDKYIYRRRMSTNVLPLPTREPERAKFDKGFISVVGGVVRKVNGKNIKIEEGGKRLEEIVSLGNYKGEQSEALFTHYINEQIRERNEGNISTFKQIESIPFADDKSERKGESDYVSFIFDTFIGDNVEQVRKILQNINDPNLITEILEFLSIATEGNEEKGQIIYKNHFPKLKEQFLSDLETLSKHPDFLLDNIASLFVHYTFVAMSQIILHTNKVTDFDGNRLIPVYYILQWEKAARWRSSYKHGYGMMKGEIDGFFSHEHALNILGLNTFTEERNLFYHDLEKILSEAGPEARNQFKQSIYAWLEEVYEAKTGIEVKRDSEDTNLESAFRDLAAAIREGVSKEINSRYQKSYEAIVSKFFRKNGGSLGTLLSLNQKQLLLLVAVSVRNDRIELKQLWKEFELRGVWLDHQSKEEVVQVLDKLSYMEKKSDSGDAQYVKSIL